MKEKKRKYIVRLNQQAPITFEQVYVENESMKEHRIYGFREGDIIEIKGEIKHITKVK